PLPVRITNFSFFIFSAAAATINECTGIFCVQACSHLAHPTQASYRTVRSQFTDGLRGDGCRGFSPGRHNSTGYPYCHLACLFRIENQDTVLPACCKIRNNGIGGVICPVREAHAVLV